MITGFLRFKVKDYEDWKRAYDLGAELRERYHVRSSSVYRTAKDANQVTVLQEFDDLESALALSNSDELRSKMAESGVMGPPDVWFTEQVEQR